MRKAVVILAVAMAFCTRLHAQSYDYLTFQTSDGTLYSIKAVGLTITFADGKMKAVVGSESLSISLSDLTKMYFSDTNGIDVTESVLGNTPVDVFSIDGKEIGSYQNMDAARASLRPGAYVLKAGDKTVKMTIR